MRIAVLAPHFAEYSTRLAVALAARANVLVINEAANVESECEGLRFGKAFPDVERAAYSGRIALGGRSLRRFFTLRKICRTIEKFRPDLIHVQEQGDAFTAAIVDRFAGAWPIVLTVHDPVPHSGNDAIVAQRYAAGLARLRSAASAYHVHGSHCEALLRQKLKTSKPIAATTHGVILVPEPAQMRDGEDRFLFFGRMEAYKGLETLLDAIERLPPSNTSRFVLAGRGPELERWRRRADAYPSIEIIDTFLSPPSAIREFQRAKAVLVPYRDATQSGVISAALGNGRPVVASRVGGLVDTVTDGVNGLLIPPDDPAALATAIQRLSDPSTCAKLAEGARAAATQRFSWSAVADALHDLYRDLTARKGHPA